MPNNINSITTPRASRAGRASARPGISAPPGVDIDMLRSNLAVAVEIIIAVVDVLDADPDLEPDTDAEPEELDDDREGAGAWPGSI